MSKLDFSKKKNFWSSKGTVNKIKGNPMSERKYLQIKYLVKTFIQNTYRTPNNRITRKQHNFKKEEGVKILKEYVTKKPYVNNR